MRRFGFTTLPVLALCAASAFGQQYRELLKNDPLLEALTLPRIVSLGDLLKSPEAYRGLSVRLIVAFSDHGKLENPFFTRFTTNNYMNFAAWDDDQPIWKQDEYLKSYPLLFVRRSAPVSELFVGAKRFDRYVVEAVVQDTFRGRPWIEITTARKEEAALSIGALRHLFHANKQSELGNYSLASGEVQRALNAPLPDHHRVEALMLAASIQEKLGDYSAARASWEEVLNFEPENAKALAERDRLVLREEAAEAEESNEVPPAEGTTPEMKETPEFLEPPKPETPEGGGEAPKTTEGSSGKPGPSPSPAPENNAQTPPNGNSGNEPAPAPAKEGGSATQTPPAGGNGAGTNGGSSTEDPNKKG